VLLLLSLFVNSHFLYFFKHNVGNASITGEMDLQTALPVVGAKVSVELLDGLGITLSSEVGEGVAFHLHVEFWSEWGRIHDSLIVARGPAALPFVSM